MTLAGSSRDAKYGARTGFAGDMPDSNGASPPGLETEDLDAFTCVLTISGDARHFSKDVRSRATTAIAAGRTLVIVDLSDATHVSGPLAWEMSRANERLAWRGGRLTVVPGAAALDHIFDAFALHETPATFETRAEAVAAGPHAGNGGPG